MDNNAGNGVTQLAWDQFEFIMGVIPEEVKFHLKQKEFKGSMLAGGFIRALVGGEQVADIDLFVPTKEMAESLAETLGADSSSQHAYTDFSGVMPIQVIHRWLFKSPEDLLAGFDFTVTQAVIWWDGWEWMSLTAPTFYEDVKAKRLVYTNPKVSDGPGSTIRLFKYIKRGYSISSENYAKVTARLMTEVLHEDYSHQKGFDIDQDSLSASIMHHLINEENRRTEDGY